jgi:hypothetical protein
MSLAMLFKLKNGLASFWLFEKKDEVVVEIDSEILTRYRLIPGMIYNLSELNGVWMIKSKGGDEKCHSFQKRK